MSLNSMQDSSPRLDEWGASRWDLAFLTGSSAIRALPRSASTNQILWTCQHCGNESKGKHIHVVVTHFVFVEWLWLIVTLLLVRQHRQIPANESRVLSSCTSTSSQAFDNTTSHDKRFISTYAEASRLWLHEKKVICYIGCLAIVEKSESRPNIWMAKGHGFRYVFLTAPFFIMDFKAYKNVLSQLSIFSTSNVLNMEEQRMSALRVKPSEAQSLVICRTMGGGDAEEY